MPGSSTTQDRICACVDAHLRFAFRCDNGVGVPIDSFAAQWLAYTHPCRRFAPGLAADDARLGADAVRYSFIVVDLHHLLLAGLPAHCHRNASTAVYSGADRGVNLRHSVLQGDRVKKFVTNARSAESVDLR